MLAFGDLFEAMKAGVPVCEDLVQGAGFGPTCPVTRAEAAYEAAQDAARAVLRLKPLHASDPMLQIVAQLIDFGLGMESEADRTAFQGMMLALVPLWRASAATPTARMAVQIVRCSLTAFVRLSEAMHTPIQSAAVQVMATALAQSPLSSPASDGVSDDTAALEIAAF
ncbi:MAG: hypothetical protein CFE34_01815 [Rhodobacteraceae bacterium PARR1]|nr:MAG: hypothetical protein CFE34_01815 [Rhodobacteraceae bacterium PARR1]